MGSRFEVHVWEEIPSSVPVDFKYRCVYAGDSLWEALWALRKAKRTGKYGCVKLEWR